MTTSDLGDGQTLVQLVSRQTVSVTFNADSTVNLQMVCRSIHWHLWHSIRTYVPHRWSLVDDSAKLGGYYWSVSEDRMAQSISSLSTVVERTVEAIVGKSISSADWKCHMIFRRPHEIGFVSCLNRPVWFRVTIFILWIFARIARENALESTHCQRLSLVTIRIFARAFSSQLQLFMSENWRHLTFRWAHYFCFQRTTIKSCSFQS